MMSTDRIVICDPNVVDGGGTGVPPTQHIGGRHFVEKGRVRVDALAFKDGGGAFRERHSGRVEVMRPRSGEDWGGVHVVNPTRQ